MNATDVSDTLRMALAASGLDRLMSVIGSGC